MSTSDIVTRILASKPSQRSAGDVEQLINYFSEQPFFKGVSYSSLEVLSSCLALQHADRGEVILHPGELTDRLFLLLRGRVWVVRHSRREGFKPEPPQLLSPGQSLCEGALVAAGRRCDVAVRTDEPPPQQQQGKQQQGEQQQGEQQQGEQQQEEGSQAAGAGTETVPTKRWAKVFALVTARKGTKTGAARDGDISDVDEEVDGGELEGGGAVFAVLTRAAWNHMCAQAPVKAQYGEARLALLCCAARSLAGSAAPGTRTLEQSEDLAALLKQMPGLSGTSTQVLRALAESASVAHLPAGTVMFEEASRADSHFLVLAGTVETHTRPRRKGAANRAALRSALKSAASRCRSAKGPQSSQGSKLLDPPPGPPKTLAQKIEEERQAREAIKQALALQRESLRSPTVTQIKEKPTIKAKAVEQEFKRWMLEFLNRKRANDAVPTYHTSQTFMDEPIDATRRSSPHARDSADSLLDDNLRTDSKPISAWRRASNRMMHTDSGDGSSLDVVRRNRSGYDVDSREMRMSLLHGDTTLMEYERRKKEEALGAKGIGQLLGGAAAGKAYLRGISRDYHYGQQEAEPQEDGSALGPELPSGSSVHWGTENGAISDDHVDELTEEADLWIRLTYLNSRFQVANKAIRYVDGVEKVMGVAKTRPKDPVGPKTTSNEAPKQPAGGARVPVSAGGSIEAEESEGHGHEYSELLLQSEGETETEIDAVPSRAPSFDGSGNVAAPGGGGGSIRRKPLRTNTGTTASVGGRGKGPTSPPLPKPVGPGERPSLPGPGDIVDDATDEHLDQLYGPQAGQMEIGQVVGEVPQVVVDKPARPGHRPRRQYSAIAGPGGVDVLVVLLEALRRGHDAARDALVSERLALMMALEPLRGLSDEHRAALALGGNVVKYDMNCVVVRQGQQVEALYIVLEGELRLLDDIDNATFGAASVPPGASGAGQEPPPRLQPTPLGRPASLRARRMVSSLPALTLLGPGGTFGEAVLGYPEDVAAEQDRTAEEDMEAHQTPPSAQHLCTAMASRPSKLLVLPRSLLLKYGYLRAALPPFAALRREALTLRRQQLKAALNNVSAISAPPPGVAITSLTAFSTYHNLTAGRPAGEGLPPPVSPRSLPALQLPHAPPPAPVPSPPTCGALSPRPHALVRPTEFFYQLGYKPVLRRMYNMQSKLLPAPSNVAVPANAGTAAAGTNCTGSFKMRNISDSGTAPAAPTAPAPTAAGPAAAAANIPSQRVPEPLCAAHLVRNTPQYIPYSPTHSRGDESTSANFDPWDPVHGVAMALVPPTLPWRRKSADGTPAGALDDSSHRQNFLLTSLSPFAHGNSPTVGTSPARLVRMSMSGLPVAPGAGGGAVVGSSSPNLRVLAITPTGPRSMSGAMPPVAAAVNARATSLTANGAVGSPMHIAGGRHRVAGGLTQLPRLSAPGNVGAEGAVGVSSGAGAMIGMWGRPQQRSTAVNDALALARREASDGLRSLSPIQMMVRGTGRKANSGLPLTSPGGAHGFFVGGVALLPAALPGSPRHVSRA